MPSLLVRIDYLDAVKNILQVLPDSKKVVVIVGTSPLRSSGRKFGREIAQPLADRVHAICLGQWNFRELDFETRRGPAAAHCDLLEL